MRFKRLFIAASAACFCTAAINAYTVIAPSSQMAAPSSFAIIADSGSWEACSAEMQEFADQLLSENLPTYIVYDKWENPEQVKKAIKDFYKKHKIEGVMLVGDVPIPMIRKAQFLTSAFKMDENIDWRESSVPSDRFYDDFHLKFDLLKPDSVKSNFFYYNLAADSPQDIKCDIYSARVKPIANGEDKATQLKRFFNKATAEHRTANKLDQFYSHTGEGSYSNSLNAWTAEAFTLREQMPGTFDSPASPGRTRFTRYSFSAYPKDDIIRQITRDDLDLGIFHEHGVPERQYISAIPTTDYVDDHAEVLHFQVREQARRAARDSARFASFEKAYTKYGLSPSWWEGYNHPDTIAADSITDARSGIMLADITAFKPNCRFVIFDACYNGDFREDDCIASRYIFADGKTVTTFANSVNVLQDKASNELLGLLWLGARAGQWARETNILESHILGDPTMRFASADPEVDAAAICSMPYSEKMARNLLGSPYADIRNLAMHQLWKHDAKGISDLLKNVYLTSDVAMERYTALSLLEKINDDNYRGILPATLADPYEFTRRTTATRMGKVGLDEYVKPLVDAYFDDTQSERVIFQIENNMPAFSKEAFDAAIASYSGERAEALKKAQASRDERHEGIVNPKEKKSWRKLYMQSLRNNNMHSCLHNYLNVLFDPNETDEIKLTLLEALAWYDESYRRGEIIDACKKVMKSTKSKEIKQQALRTINRLK